MVDLAPPRPTLAALSSAQADSAVLEQRSWRPVLERFSEATGLAVAWLDQAGAQGFALAGASPLWRLICDVQSPPVQARIGAHLQALRLAAEQTDAPQEAELFDLLRVRVLPLSVVVAQPTVAPRGEASRACIVFGYAMRRFGTSHDAARIARELELPSHQTHRAASALRATRPVGDARFETYAELLDTLVAAKLRDLRALRELAQHERARELLVAHVSHELRTPLMSSTLRIQLLLDSALDDPAEVRRQLGLLRNNVADEAELVEDLIEVARMRTGQMSVERARTRLLSVVERAIETIAPRAERKQITIGLEAEDASGQRVTASPHTTPSTERHADELWGDTARLHQVFTNLLTNAVKFTAAGGRVAVKVQLQVDWILVEVCDDGCGIEPALLARVFDAFAQAEPGSHKGLGLGLAVAKQLVSLHGGEISAHSEGHGRGSTFLVRLPRTEAPAGAPPPGRSQLRIR